MLLRFDNCFLMDIESFNLGKMSVPLVCEFAAVERCLDLRGMNIFACWEPTFHLETM